MKAIRNEKEAKQEIMGQRNEILEDIQKCIEKAEQKEIFPGLILHALHEVEKIYSWKLKHMTGGEYDDEYIKAIAESATHSTNHVLEKETEKLK
jgi:hypothetical protein